MVTLFDEGLTNPRGIAVHPAMGRLFWTDWDRANPRHTACLNLAYDVIGYFTFFAAKKRLPYVTLLV